MGLLLYKSDEMYSSTELIRKSKMIFDKVLDKEIEKAIILRDGKPCFLLMEFQKYEKIMAEYEELKQTIETLKKNNTTEKKLKKPTKNPQISTDTEIINNNHIQEITPEDKTKIAKLTKQEAVIEQKKAISNTIKNDDSINTDDKKEKVESRKLRILKAREERAKILANENQHKEDLKEELILQTKLKEKKLQKDRELQEFWD